MAYIGNSPALKYASFAVQHFTTSATTSYALSNSVANENEIALFINNVRQQPGSSYAYTAAGTTLTLSAATTSSDTMYCVFIGKAVQTVVPPDGSVDSAQLATDAVTTVKITDTNVTGAKLNDDAISAQDALGAAPADTDEFLVSDAGVLKRVDYSYIKGITQTSFLPTAQPLIINGNMKVSQRATSKTGLTNGSAGYWVQDRWKWLEYGAPTFVQTMTQESLTSGDAFADGFANALKLDVTTADASLAAGDALQVEQQIEGQNLQMIKKGTANAEKLTVAFWIKSTKTGTLIAELFDHDNSRTCSQSYTIDTTDTWEFKVLNFPADTTGALNNSNTTGLALKFWLGAGTNYTSGTLATTWESETAANRAVGCVNTTDSTSNNVHITGVQMEVGEYTSADLPPFRHESYGDNLQRCERYYQVIAKGVDNAFLFNANNFDGTNIEGAYNYSPQMRAVPSIDQDTGTSYFEFRANNANAAFDSFNYMDNGSGQHALRFYSTGGGGSTSAGQGGSYRLGNASAGVAMDAEL